MALSSSSATIFDLSKEDLSSILQTLKPTIDPTTANSMSVCELRTQITEWLMLNDFSTMHNFKHIENSQEWKIPDKTDQCISCGKYIVNSIDLTNVAEKNANAVIDQPLTNRESLVFVGRSTNLPSSVLHIIDFSKPLNSTITLQTSQNSNGNNLMNKKKHGYEYGKDLCSKCAQWTLPNLNCFPNGQQEWNNFSNSTIAKFFCFSYKC